MCGQEAAAVALDELLELDEPLDEPLELELDEVEPDEPEDESLDALPEELFEELSLLDDSLLVAAVEEESLEEERLSVR